MASSSSASREQHDALTSKSKELTRELKRLKAITQKTNKRRRYGGFTECEQYFACRLYLLAAHEPRVAIMYLREKQDARTSSSFGLLDDAGLKTLVEQWFNGLSANELQYLHPPFIPEAQKLHDKASLFLQEHQLRLWVLDQNVNKGLAPTTGNMNMEFDRIHAPLAAFNDPTSRGDVALSRNRMWSHRFRKKWDMILGKVPARDFMSTALITEKVVFFFSCSKKKGASHMQWGGRGVWRMSGEGFVTSRTQGFGKTSGSGG